MTVLVTGATGFLGSHIAERLARSGRQVRALVRTSSDVSFLSTLPNLALAHGSVEDSRSLVEASKGVDAIIHSAGLVKGRTPNDFFRVNAVGTENVVQAALEAESCRRLVLVSSLAAIGPSDALGNPVLDDQTPGPITTYGKSKLEAERAVLRAKDRLQVVILRPPAIYGPRDREVLVFFKSVKNGVLPLTNPLAAKLSMIYGADAAMACVNALEAEVPSGSAYYLDDGLVYTFGQMIELTEKALGKRAFIRLPLPRKVVRAAALGSELYGKFTGQAVMFTREKCNDLFSQWVCDGSRARRELGWQPEVTFPVGVKLTAEWYREAGWL